MEKFSKSERLCSRKSVGKLFAGGKSLFHYPFRLAWSENEDRPSSPARVAIAVPRKKIRKAVVRNRIKRMTRESWRKNKESLYQGLVSQDRTIDVILIYVAGAECDYTTINNSIIELSAKLLSNNETG